MYVNETPLAEFRQGEIISGLVQYEFDPTVGPHGRARALTHQYSIVASQDCDLLRYHEARDAQPDGILNGILIYEAERGDDARVRMREELHYGAKDWKRVRLNKDERYHLLAEAPAELDLAGEGLPSLILDFRRFFTIPPKEIYRQCTLGSAKRRCRLNSPYREHLQARLAYYLQRVAIPEPSTDGPPKDQVLAD